MADLIPASPMPTVVLAVSFFFQAEDGIRDLIVTGVQTCALPILRYWGESDVRVVGRQRARIAPAADKLIALGASRLAGENGMVARPGCQRGFERDKDRKSVV